MRASIKDIKLAISILYDEDIITVGKVIVRILIIGALLPLQMFVWGFGMGFAHDIDLSLAKLFGTTPMASDAITTDSFGDIFLTAASVFIIHVLLYTIIWLVTKVKPHFDMLVSLAAVTLISRNDLFDKRVGWIFPGFSIAWNYAYAFILFVIFCAAIILTKHLPIKIYCLRILVSTVGSLLLGIIVCNLIWWSVLVPIIVK